VKKTFLGRCDDEGTWRFAADDNRALTMHLASLAGQKIAVTIEDDKHLRSIQANNYYWSQVATVLAKENGQTPEEFHDAMCVLFLPNESKRVEFFNKMTGESLTVEVDTRRSSKLTGGPFYDFVERVRLWGVEFLGVITEDPDPEYWRKRKAA
jgi:hypothetical protein